MHYTATPHATACAHHCQLYTVHSYLLHLGCPGRVALLHYHIICAAEPALGIGKLGSRLGPPIGGGLAQEHKKKSLDYSQFIRDFAAIKARKVIFVEGL